MLQVATKVEKDEKSAATWQSRQMFRSIVRFRKW